MISCLDMNKCCGCGACINICQRKAISMKPDIYGFDYPVVDEDLCINCGKCVSVCQIENKNISLNNPVKCFAAVNKNKDVLKTSSSGGVFGQLADFVLKQNGVVFGCRFDNNIVPVHTYTENLEEIVSFQGSKYVQSKTGEAFLQVKRFLEENRLVLFTGTPCQVAGLLTFLGKAYINLLTADLSCHGVPSYGFFKDYILYLERKYKIKITDFRFRGKYDGWGKTIRLQYLLKNKIKHRYIQDYNSYYVMGFIKRQIMRESCYQCSYMRNERIGDFTMCDYWGAEKQHPEINSANGISAFLVNTEKGMKALEMIQKGIDLYPSKLEKIIKQNGSLREAAQKPPEREKILSLWQKYGCEKLDKEYMASSHKYRIKRAILRKIPKRIKRMIKR